VVGVLVDETFRKNGVAGRSARSAVKASAAAERSRTKRSGAVVAVVEENGLRILGNGGESVISFPDAEKKISYVLGIGRIGESGKGEDGEGTEK